MSRYTSTLRTGRTPEDVQRIVADYLGGEGFKLISERGESVWRKGTGWLAAPQFMRVEAASDGTAILEAWTAGFAFLPGIYAGEMNPMEGIWGTAPKMALKPRIRELEGRLGGSPTLQA